MKEKSSIRIIDIHIEFPQDQDPNKTSHHSSMVSNVACYRGGPGFKSQQVRELLVLNKKEKCKGNMNYNIKCKNKTQYLLFISYLF